MRHFHCPSCGYTGPAPRRWGTLAHLHVWGVLILGVLVAWPLLVYWPLGLVLTLLLGGKRVCARCGSPYIVEMLGRNPATP